ncbi:MAG: ABC transporter permease [Thermoanaerobaculia bacterium]|nr:ABC transporter permease [Thermoanaerobaculia bacterium]
MKPLRMKFREALRMAFAAVRINKLRSSLTLVGIIAGVASVISVMTAISVVQGAIEQEMSVLGTTTFQVQKFPNGSFGNEEERRKILQRKPVTIENANAVRERVKSVDLVGAELWQGGVSASFRQEKTKGRLSVVGGTPEYPDNNTHYLDFGRNLSNEDVAVGRSVAVIGFAVAEQLFPFIDPLGQEMKVDGRDYEVIGVFAEKTSAIGGNFDNYILIPISRFQRAFGMREADGSIRSVNMTVRARSAELLGDAIEETRAVLRADRRVRPGAEDDFYYFTNDSMIKEVDNATAGVKLGAFLIGTIALVVAGIGIMNIMLVSVAERTREIGMRKALGAKRRDILWQFLLEAVLLCNVGGALGVGLGLALGNVLILFTSFEVSVPLDWAANGLVFCTAIGLIFGLWPALRAARLSPIEALNSE